MLERLLMAGGLALIISLILGPFLIPLLHTLKFGQNIREDHILLQVAQLIK
jgi:phospho-N-acetylmuramoyl-pentapeptide-transferase